MNRIGSSVRRLLIAAVLTMTLGQSSPGQAQFRDYGRQNFTVGLKVGGVLGKTDLADQADFQVRGHLGHGLTEKLGVELGTGYASLKGSDFQTHTGRVDFRFLLTPARFKRWSPYLYAGAGALRYQLHTIPRTRTPGAKRIGWTGIIPMGGGIKLKLSERLSLDLSGGYTHSFSDVLDASALKADKDAYWGATIGFELGRHPDPDRDGLYHKAEKRLGTNPRLNDTDGDGLSDGDEVRKYKTNPLVRDTDGDELSDGDEVNRYRTNPLLADTDGDGVADGAEVALGKDPLAADKKAGDAEKASQETRAVSPAKAVEMAREEHQESARGQAVYFDFDQYALREGDKEMLSRYAEGFRPQANARLTIEGHCDERGTVEYNLALGQKRADSVREFLVRVGVPAQRLSTVSYGKERPADPRHDTAAWAKNRRVVLAPAD